MTHDAGNTARMAAHAQRVDLTQLLVARAYAITIDDMHTRTRKPRAPEARQVAIYLAHTVLGLSLRELSRETGCHLSTAIHACRRVELKRDHAEFDRTLCALERQLRSVTGVAA